MEGKEIPSSLVIPPGWTKVKATGVDPVLAHMANPFKSRRNTTFSLDLDEPGEFEIDLHEIGESARDTVENVLKNLHGDPGVEIVFTSDPNRPPRQPESQVSGEIRDLIAEKIKQFRGRLKARAQSLVDKL